MIADGAVAEVTHYLGRNFSIAGRVVHGADRGKSLGFPTANIATDKELIPADGVYAVKVKIDEVLFDAACNIGFNPTFDLGKKSIQCGRRVDAVKLWFGWKYYGKNGYEKRINHSISMAEYAEEKVNSHPNLELLASRQSFAVCFRYVPENETNLNDFNLKIREKLRKNGKTLVNYGYLDKKLGIRLVIANSELQKEDIDLFFNYFTSTANELLEKKHKQYEYIN